eukprot:242817-Chlamydomonas_euryale.AAC.5
MALGRRAVVASYHGGDKCLVRATPLPAGMRTGGCCDGDIMCIGCDDTLLPNYTCTQKEYL